MGEDVTQIDPVFHVDGETTGDEMLQLVGEPVEVWVDQSCSFNLSVCFERDVTTGHVVEEDAEGPDGEAVGFVPPVLDPLRRGVHSGSIKIGVYIFLAISSGAEINKFDLIGGNIYENIFIFNVSMNNSSFVALNNCF